MQEYKEFLRHSCREFRYYQHIEIDAVMRRRLGELFAKETKSSDGARLV